MAIPSLLLPSKCCCGCRLQTWSIASGAYTMVLAITFLGIEIEATRSYDPKICVWQYVYGDSRQICSPPNEFRQLASHLMAILSLWNIVEVMMSVGLIWGASKAIIWWLTAWLVVTVCWIALHSAIAAALLLSSSNSAAVISISVLGVFLLGPDQDSSRL